MEGFDGVEERVVGVMMGMFRAWRLERLRLGARGGDEGSGRRDYSVCLGKGRAMRRYGGSRGGVDNGAGVERRRDLTYVKTCCGRFESLPCPPSTTTSTTDDGCVAGSWNVLRVGVVLWGANRAARWRRPGL